MIYTPTEALTDILEKENGETDNLEITKMRTPDQIFDGMEWNGKKEISYKMKYILIMQKQ